MTLLDHYLRAVRLYLPKGPQTDDIIVELSENLQSKFEELELDRGRPLTAAEQEAVLVDHGSPLVVAARYGAINRGLAFGRQLISPEVFPLYIRVLLTQYVLTIVVVSAIAPFAKTWTLTPGRYLYPMLFQFLLTTSIFIAVDFFQRRRRSGGFGPGSRQLWSFPPPYMQEIPRWQSVSGGIVLGTIALWWGAIPYVPSLLLGGRSSVLALMPSWHAFYWPVLLLLLIGVAQRIATFVRPDWNWLQPATRLLTNGVTLALVYPFLLSYPYVQVQDGVTDAAAPELARRLNNSIWWNALASFSLYWLITAAFSAWMCVQHARQVLRRRRPQVS